MSWDYNINPVGDWFNQYHELLYAIASFILAGYLIFILCWKNEIRTKIKLKKGIDSIRQEDC